MSGTNPTIVNVNRIVRRPWLYWWTVGILLTLTVLSLLWTLIGTGHPWYNIRSGSLIFVVLFTTICISVREIDVTKETVGIKVLGMATILISQGGIWIIIPLLMRRVTATKTTRQNEFPGDPEFVFDGDDADFEAANRAAGGTLVKATRIMTGGPADQDQDETDPLKRRLQPKVRGTVSYTISDPLSFEAAVGTDKEAFRQLNDTWRNALATEFGLRTPAQIVFQLEEIRGKVGARIAERVKYWGVQITETNVEPPDFGKTVAAALASQGAGVAQADVTRTVATATAFATKLQGEAEGKASFEREKGFRSGQAAGLEELMTKLKIESGETILAADVAGRIQEKTDVIVATDGLAGILGAALKALGGFKKP